MTTLHDLYAKKGPPQKIWPGDTLQGTSSGDTYIPVIDEYSVRLVRNGRVSVSTYGTKPSDGGALTLKNLEYMSDAMSLKYWCKESETWEPLDDLIEEMKALDPTKRKGLCCDDRIRSLTDGTEYILAHAGEGKHCLVNLRTGNSRAHSRRLDTPLKESHFKDLMGTHLEYQLRDWEVIRRAD
jgi:hypothetical protein